MSPKQAAFDPDAWLKNNAVAAKKAPTTAPEPTASEPAAGFDPDTWLAKNTDSPQKSGLDKGVLPTAGRIVKSAVPNVAAGAVEFGTSTAGAFPYLAGELAQMEPPRTPFSISPDSLLTEKQIEKLTTEPRQVSVFGIPIPGLKLPPMQGKEAETLKEFFLKTPERTAQLEKARALEYPFREAVQPAGAAISATGKAVIDIGKEWASKIPFQTSPEVTKPEGWKFWRWDHPVEKVFALSGRALPGIAAAGGLTKKLIMKGLGNRAAGLLGSATLAPQIAEGFYTEARSNGVPREQAFQGAMADAIFATITESMVLPGIVTGQGHIVNRVIKGAIQESIEEGVQQPFENWLKVNLWDEARPFSERMMEGVMEGVLVGAVSGGALGAAYGGDTPPAVLAESASVRAERIIEAEGKKQGKTPEQIQAAKDAARPVIDRLVSDALQTGGKIQKNMDRAVADQIKDFTDIHKGAIVTNVEDDAGTTHVIKSNPTPAFAQTYMQQSRNMLEQILAQVETQLERKPETPGVMRNQLENLIAMKLANGESKNEIIEEITGKMVSRAKDLPGVGGKTVAWLVSPIKDATDQDVSIYSVDNLTKMPLRSWLNVQFAKGLTPSDIVLRQQTMAGQKTKWTEQAREIVRLVYADGLNKGLWTRPEPPAPPEAPVLTMPPEGPAPALTQVVKVISGGQTGAAQPAAPAPAPVSTPAPTVEPPNIAKVPLIFPLSKQQAQDLYRKYYNTAKQNNPDAADDQILHDFIQDRSRVPLGTVTGEVAFKPPTAPETAPSGMPKAVVTATEDAISELWDQIDTLADQALVLEDRYAAKQITPEEYQRLINESRRQREELKTQIETLRQNNVIHVEFTTSVADARKDHTDQDLGDQVADVFSRMREIDENGQIKTDPNAINKEDAVEAKLSGDNADWSSIKNFYDLLRDWSEALSPYLPERGYYEPKKVYFQRAAKQVEANRRLLEEAKKNPLFHDVNNLFLAEAKGLLNSMTPEMAAKLEDLVDFGLRKVSDTAGVNVAEKLAGMLTATSNYLASKVNDVVPWAMSQAEQEGGVTFEILDEPVTIITKQGDLSIPIGRYDWRKVDNTTFEFDLGGNTYQVDISELNKMIGNPNINMDWMHFYAGLPLNDYGKSLFDALTPIKNYFRRYSKSRKGTDRKKWGHLHRKQPARILLEMSRIFRFNPDAIFDWLYGSELKKSKALERIPRYGPASDQVRQLLLRDKKFAMDIKNIIHEQLRQYYGEMRQLVEQRLAQQGVTNKKEIRDFMDNVITKLLSRAGEMVTANEDYPDTGHYAFTNKANSKHINLEGKVDPEEHRAYYNDIIKFHEALGIQPTPADLARWADLNGNREPYAWDLLGKFMGDDSLQQLLLWTKSQMEMPYLNEMLANGVFANTDIYQSVKDGWTRRVFDQTEQQRPSVFWRYRKSSLSSTSKPKRNVYSYERFVSQGDVGGWIAVDDYFTSLADYAFDSFFTVHQAQTLSSLRAHTARVQHSRPEYLKVSPGAQLVPVIEFRHSPLAQQEAKKLSQALGKPITVDAVLESWGFRQGKQMPGLVEWYRGAFAPPYVHIPVADLFETMFENTAVDRGPSQLAFDAMRVVKFIKTYNPFDTPGLWLAVALVDHPVKLFTIPVRALGAGVKGLTYVPKILTGNWQTLGRVDTKIKNIDLMLRTGCQAVGGYSSAMESWWDKVGRKHIPEMNSPWENAKEFFWSIGGVQMALFNDMIAKDVAMVWNEKYEQYKKTMGEEDAAYRASDYLNHATFMLHRSIWNREGRWLQMSIFSRNLMVGVMRNALLLTYNVPFVAPTLKKAGILKYHTSRVGRLFNSTLASEMTDTDRKVLSAEMLRSTLKMLIYSLVSKGFMQYLLSFGDDDEKDEHGEIGNDPSTWKDPEHGPRKRNILYNEEGAWGRVRLSKKDWYQRQIYADFQIFRYIRDLYGLTTNPGKWVNYRASLFTSALMQLVRNRDSEGTPIWNENDKWLKRQMQKLGFVLKEDFTPIGAGLLWPKLEPMVGLEEGGGTTGWLRVFEAFGGSLTRGEARTYRTAEQMKAERRKAGTGRFEEEKFKQKLRYTPNEQLNELFDYNKGLTGQSLIREYWQRYSPEREFDRSNRAILQRKELRDRETGGTDKTPQSATFDIDEWIQKNLGK